MNIAQLLYCHLNILKDEEEEETLWKDRLKYMGLFVNPEIVNKMIEYENNESNNLSQHQYNGPQTIVNGNQIIEKGEIVENDNFDEELKKALEDNNSPLMELPEHEYGNKNMSKDEFINFAASMEKDINKFEDIQKQADEKVKQAYLNKHQSNLNHEKDINNDLDYFECDDDDDNEE